MARSGQRASQLEKGSIDRVEAAVLHGREGDEFAAVVLGARGKGARVQLENPPVTATIETVEVEAGSAVTLRLDSADIATGAMAFTPVPSAG